ncbi:MAG: hypothetical protein K2X27_27125 [Candidatus Obscuribacterales bacterium]|nr:hypothetical protein [Candidatus Obscuribacterales bacterium]
MTGKLAELDSEPKAQSPSSAARSKSLPFQFIAAFCLFLVLSLMLEQCFALAGIGEGQFMKLDPLYGFVPETKKAVTWRGEGFSRFQYNSFSMQDREYPLKKAAGQQRIAMLGDSYVEAIQVSRKQNFCSLLENLLNEGSNDRSIEVQNFGLSSYSLYMMLLRLEKLALAFHPDLVVLNYHVNEVMKAEAPAIAIDEMSLGSAHPYLRFNKEKAAFEADYSTQAAWQNSAQGKWLKATEGFSLHSRIASVVLHSVWELRNFLLKSVDSLSALLNHQKPKSPVNYWVDEPPYKFTEQHWPSIHYLLKTMQADCRKAGAKFVIVRLPAFRANKNELEAKLLEKSAAELGIEYLDLDAGTRSWSDEQLAALFFGGNGHYNIQGHKYLSEQLNNFLRSKKLLAISK